MPGGGLTPFPGLVASAALSYTLRASENRPVVFTLRNDNLLDEKKAHYINIPRPSGCDVTTPARWSKAPL